MCVIDPVTIKTKSEALITAHGGRVLAELPVIDLDELTIRTQQEVAERALVLHVLVNMSYGAPPSYCKCGRSLGRCRYEHLIINSERPYAEIHTGSIFSISKVTTLMKPYLASLALLIAALLAPAAHSALPAIQHDPHSGETVMVMGTPAPHILHITDTDRDTILANADILIFWEGDSKFGEMLFKHKGIWYGTAGFMGSTYEFLMEEAKITQGTIVYVSESNRPFEQTKYGFMISTSIAKGKNEDWKFYYTEKYNFGKFPAYRQYYDEKNVKIKYDDY